MMFLEKNANQSSRILATDDRQPSAVGSPMDAEMVCVEVKRLPVNGLGNYTSPEKAACTDAENEHDLPFERLGRLS